MGLFNLFKKNKKEEINPINNSPINNQKSSERRFIEHNCELCGKQIGKDKWTKIQGKHFHKSCFKQKVKAIKK